MTWGGGDSPSTARFQHSIKFTFNKPSKSSQSHPYRSQSLQCHTVFHSFKKYFTKSFQKKTASATRSTQIQVRGNQCQTTHYSSFSPFTLAVNTIPFHTCRSSIYLNCEGHWPHFWRLVKNIYFGTSRWAFKKSGRFSNQQEMHALSGHKSPIGPALNYTTWISVKSWSGSRKSVISPTLWTNIPF